MIRYRKNPEHAGRVIKGVAYIVKPDTNMMHVLNETGSFLWSQFTQPLSAQELVEALREEYDVSEQDAASDVQEFLEELLRVDVVLKDAA